MGFGQQGGVKAAGAPIGALVVAQVLIAVFTRLLFKCWPGHEATNGPLNCHDMTIGLQDLGPGQTKVCRRFLHWFVAMCVLAMVKSGWPDLLPDVLTLVAMGMQGSFNDKD